MKMKPEDFKAKLKQMGYWRAIGALETAEAVSKLTPSAPMFQIAVLLSSTSTSMSSQARPPPPPPNNKEERKEVNVNTPQRQQPVQQQQQYYWYPPYWYPPQYQPPPTNQQYQGAQSQRNLVFLGDSLLVRLLNVESLVQKFKNDRIIDLSVSGSRIEEAVLNLDRELHSNPYKLNNSIMIILLGTNDFLRNGQFNFKGYELIVNMACNFCTRILLVTVPPIPRLPKFNPEICVVNEWIRRFQIRERVSVIESTHFRHPESAVDLSLFEKTYFSGKTDLVHLNRKGLTLLGNAILQQVMSI